jgi:hypothetical protein
MLERLMKRSTNCGLTRGCSGPTFAKSPTRQSRYGDGAAMAGMPGRLRRPRR